MINETVPADQTSPNRPQTGVTAPSAPRPSVPPVMPKEIGGPKGPEPTRYGDWEQKGRCSDF